MKVVIKGMSDAGKTTYREIEVEDGQQAYIDLCPNDSQVIVRTNGATLIGVPCSCRGMTEAIELSLASVMTITFDGKESPSVGILNGHSFSPFQYCPWCGNAAIEIKEVAK